MSRSEATEGLLINAALVEKYNTELIDIKKHTQLAKF